MIENKENFRNSYLDLKVQGQKSGRDKAASYFLSCAIDLKTHKDYASTSCIENNKKHIAREVFFLFDEVGYKVYK